MHDLIQQIERVFAAADAFCAHGKRVPTEQPSRYEEIVTELEDLECRLLAKAEKERICAGIRQRRWEPAGIYDWDPPTRCGRTLLLQFRLREKFRAVLATSFEQQASLHRETGGTYEKPHNQVRSDCGW